MGVFGYKKLYRERADWLEKEVSVEELKNAVWDCNVSKSPGPDGFNFKFYRKAWSFICNDMLDIVSEFFRTERLQEGINRTYVTLITKTKIQKGFSYRKAEWFMVYIN
jgi:hypothetical protein